MDTFRLGLHSTAQIFLSISHLKLLRIDFYSKIVAVCGSGAFLSLHFQLTFLGNKDNKDVFVNLLSFFHFSFKKDTDRHNTWLSLQHFSKGRDNFSRGDNMPENFPTGDNGGKGGGTDIY